MEPGFESLLPSHLSSRLGEAPNAPARRGPFVAGQRGKDARALMNAVRNRELDLGPHEKPVRWLEETLPEAFEREITRKLAKTGPEGWNSWLTAATLAAARSTRHDGPRTPESLSALSAIGALLPGRPLDDARALLTYGLRLVRTEMRDPAFGPYRLLHFDEVAGVGREGTIFSFLEAIRAGEADLADHRFAWLVRNLEKEQVTDLLLSSGLEGLPASANKVVLVADVVGLLQTLGWELAPLLLRPIVRHQAWGATGLAGYDRCRDLIAERDLHRVARRRPPGQAAWGERGALEFHDAAVAWAEAEPEERAARVQSILADAMPLEDVAEMISLGGTLLFLQEILRRREGGPSSEETERALHLVAGVFALCRLVRLGTPGQRILGLLLAAWVTPARTLRLQTRKADATWWLPSLAEVRERATTSGEGAGAVAPESWARLILDGQPNGLLPLVAERLAAGHDASALEGELIRLAPLHPEVPGRAVRLVRALGDAYRSARSPYRWMHLWAAGIALSLWPRQTQQTGGLPNESGRD